jgi:hypothetical protein
MVAMMTALQKMIIKRLSGERERLFFAHALKHLSTVSGKHVKFEEWMVTSYEVEFGPEIGSGGLYVPLSQVSFLNSTFTVSGKVFQGTWNRMSVALKVLKSDSGATPSSSVGLQ